MKKNNNRREFIKMATMSGISVGLSNHILGASSDFFNFNAPVNTINKTGLYQNLPFVPNRVASWWCTLDDILWPQKSVIDLIKRRAEAFAVAKIDTAMNFGFHIRFDFSNYFGQLHGYYQNVCEELHKYDIKFMDHYSCNNVERPRGEVEIRKLNKGQRHHVLLYPDPVAAKFAQYEGHLFQDICEVDLLDGGRGYAKQYQFETFCHNNPAFLDMHKKYLERLIKEVDFDGIEIDDMCDYAGLTTCGCKYCRDRFKNDYGHEIPPFGDKNFWGETENKGMLNWGNYENPVFRDWLRMKTDTIVDHLKMARTVLNGKPLMTCCSSAGPIILNSISLDLEKMAPHLDLFMLENVGTNIHSVNWVEKESEAILQKDIAKGNSNAPAMALSYTIYKKGAYLGWCLSRFWGVANWSSTYEHRLEEDPKDAMKIEDIVGAYNNWENLNSNLNYRDCTDLVEVRLVSNGFCRENGWRREDGHEQWDSVKAWSSNLVKNNIGYRILRSGELADSVALSKENTPLILDSVGCVSNNQFKAIKDYLAKDGTVWLALPFGTHTEKGFKRLVPLSEGLLKSKYKNLIIIDTKSSSDPLKKLIAEARFKPVLTQLSGDKRWAVRIKFFKDKPVIHFMNTALIAIPHPTTKDTAGIPILDDIDSEISDNNLLYKIDSNKVHLPKLSVMSPELKEQQRDVVVNKLEKGFSSIKVNLDSVKIYAVLQ
jgi:hypothetical protein